MQRRRAGFTVAVSPHWLRHATVGHANLVATSRYLYARPADSSARCLPVEGCVRKQAVSGEGGGAPTNGGGDLRPAR
ncbi:MAG: hypothetical protein NTZ05_17295 [Chloroflexi bacterium]|nr:hypothetical protein [Chloroflexota bacterium]